MKQIAIDILSDKENKREALFFDKIPETTEGKILFQCKNHDYIYVPANFEDADGVRRRGGYYDEAGKYYQHLHIIEEDEDGVIICKYCGHTVDLRKNAEVLLSMKCPNCDAGLEYLEEKKVKTAPKNVDMSEIRKPKVKAKATHKDRFKPKKDYFAYARERDQGIWKAVLELLWLLVCFRLGILSILFYNIVIIIILWIASLLGFIH